MPHPEFSLPQNAIWLLAEPSPSTLGIRWTDFLLIGCAIVPALLFAVAKGGRRSGRTRLLSILLKLGALWAGSTVMAYPAGVLIYLGTAELAAHPEAWLMTAVSPVVAFAIAWWFRPTHPPIWLHFLLLRAAVLLASCIATVWLAHRAGIPITTVAGIGAGVSLAAALACVTVWLIIDRLAPLPLLAAGTIALAAAIGSARRVSAVALLDAPIHRPVTWGVAILAIAETAGLLVMVVAVFRLYRQARTGTLGYAGHRWWGLWPPLPGQVWNADVQFWDDETESKDRPVLVVGNHRHYADVLKITSQDRSQDQHYQELPLKLWGKVLTKRAWMELRTTPVTYDRFRNVRGLCPWPVWRTLRKQDFPRHEGSQPTLKQTKDGRTKTMS